jgi:DNA repair protein RAD50
LIKNRRQQSNFQLLVITHDEAFLREMKCQEFCETYFNVGRDENQNSIIKEEPISKLMN